MLSLQHSILLHRMHQMPKVPLPQPNCPVDSSSYAGWWIFRREQGDTGRIRWVLFPSRAASSKFFDLAFGDGISCIIHLQMVPPLQGVFWNCGILWRNVRLSRILMYFGWMLSEVYWTLFSPWLWPYHIRQLHIPSHPFTMYVVRCCKGGISSWYFII